MAPIENVSYFRIRRCVMNIACVGEIPIAAFLGHIYTCGEVQIRDFLSITHTAHSTHGHTAIHIHTYHTLLHTNKIYGRIKFNKTINILSKVAVKVTVHRVVRFVCREVKLGDLVCAPLHCQISGRCPHWSSACAGELAGTGPCFTMTAVYRRWVASIC